MQPVAAARVARCQPFASEGGGITVSHHAAACPQCLAGSPEVLSANRIEHRIHTLATGEAVSLPNKVLFLIVDRDGAQFSNRCGISR